LAALDHIKNDEQEKAAQLFKGTARQWLKKLNIRLTKYQSCNFKSPFFKHLGQTGTWWFCGTNFSAGNNRPEFE